MDKSDKTMKIGEYEVNLKNAFNLIGRGFIGLFIFVLIVGKWAGVFFLWCGKFFMKFGESYGKHIDKRLNKIDKDNKKYAKQFRQY